MDPQATATSKTTINLVVIFLGVFALAALASVTFLIDGNATAANVAIVVGPMGVALGAIGGVLASTRSPIAAQLPVVTPPEHIAGPPETVQAEPAADPLAKSNEQLLNMAKERFARGIINQSEYDIIVARLGAPPDGDPNIGVGL